MKNIIFQHDMLLQNMVIVPIININDNNKEQVKKLFEYSLYVSGFKTTWQVSVDMYLLVTNKSVINKAQK